MDYGKRADMLKTNAVKVRPGLKLFRSEARPG